MERIREMLGRLATLGRVVPVAVAFGFRHSRRRPRMLRFASQTEAKRAGCPPRSQGFYDSAESRRQAGRALSWGAPATGPAPVDVPLLSVEDGEDFNVVGLGKHVEGLEQREMIPRKTRQKNLQIMCERLHVT